MMTTLGPEDVRNSDILKIVLFVQYGYGHNMVRYNIVIVGACHYSEVLLYHQVLQALLHKRCNGVGVTGNRHNRVATDRTLPRNPIPCTRLHSWNSKLCEIVAYD